MGDIRVVELCNVSATELWVFETLQGSGGPPGGLLPPGQTPARSFKYSREQRRAAAASLLLSQWRGGRMRGDSGDVGARISFLPRRT